MATYNTDRLTIGDNEYRIKDTVSGYVTSLTDLGVTATAAELNYVDGVTSNVQTQLNNKVNLAGDTMTGNLKIDGSASAGHGNLYLKTDGGAYVYITGDEDDTASNVGISTQKLQYIKNLTSDVQTQLNNKQATITGAATTIASSDLTASRALISNASGKVGVSAVTSTELGYLDGVTSNVQTQLDNKVDLAGDTMTGTLVLNGGTTGQLNAGTSASIPGIIRIFNAQGGYVAINGSKDASTNGTWKVSPYEIGCLSGVTGNIQGQLNGKLDLSGGTMTGELITDTLKVSNSSSGSHFYLFTSNGGYTRVNGAADSGTGKYVITPTELGRLNGVTSGIQSQLDDKFNTSGGTITGDVLIKGDLNADVVHAGNASNGAAGALTLYTAGGGRVTLSCSGDTATTTATVSASDLRKLSNITASSTELNTLDGIATTYTVSARLAGLRTRSSSSYGALAYQYFLYGSATPTTAPGAGSGTIYFKY